MLPRLILLLIFLVSSGILINDQSGGQGDFPSLAAIGPTPIPYRGKNRLGRAQSGYLRGAATQAVWWHEWGPEPFLLARTLRRPILLDIGAAWCHWCHVMDRVTYADKAVAELINANFIAIKVDRDERPDIDHRYQAAVQALTGAGGWPLTAFLTAAGEVYYGGGTFFPTATDGRPGFLELLPRLAEAYVREGSSIQSAAEFLRGQLRRHLALDAPAGRLDLRLAERMAQVVTEDFDRESGGFGQRGPKFFEPEAWRFLLQWVFYYPLPPWRTMIDVTCKQMARGGVYDQLGGGFHRYATDRMWYVPHFEKLLSTNAAMLRLYIDAFAGTKDTVYREVGDGIADYLLTVLRDPATGLFWNHQDADDPGGGEGTFYTWDKQELADVLTAEERQVVLLTYGVRDLPRDLPQAPDENVLRLAATVTEVAGALRWPPDRVTHVLEEARVKLHARRALRPAPEVESAAYVSSNGMAVAALLRGAQVLGRRQWAEAALTALERIWSAGWNKGTGMVRGWQGGRKRADGLLGDQVWTLLALLDAYEATGEGVWLERATLLAELIEERFIDPEGGGFFDRSLALRRGPWGLESDPVKNFFDRSEPAENPALAIAYDRLAYLTDNPDWRITAEGILLGLAGMHPGSVDRSLASYASAVLYHIRPPAHVVIVGLATDPVVEGLAIVARQTARPWTIVRVLTPEAAGAAPLPEAVRAQRQVAEAAGRPMAFLCVGTACAPPTADPTELDRQLASFALSH